MPSGRICKAGILKSPLFKKGSPEKAALLRLPCGRSFVVINAVRLVRDVFIGRVFDVVAACRALILGTALGRFLAGLLLRRLRIGIHLLRNRIKGFV